MGKGSRKLALFLAMTLIAAQLADTSVKVQAFSYESVAEEPETEQPGMGETEQAETEETGTEQPETEQPGTEETETEQAVTEETGTEQTGTEAIETENPETETIEGETEESEEKIALERKEYIERSIGEKGWKECLKEAENGQNATVNGLHSAAVKQNAQAMRQTILSQSEVLTVSSELDMLALAELTYEGEDFEGVTIKQTADITFLNPFPGLALGVEDESYQGFQGTFDGNGYVLRQLTPTRGIGLFNHIGVNGYVKNVTIINENIDLGDTEFFPLAVVNSGVIENYRFEGDMQRQTDKGYAMLSGCVWMNTGKIRNSIVDGTLTTNVGSVAGFANLNYGGEIANCYNTCDITATKEGINFGGIVGEATTVYLDGTEEVLIGRDVFPRYIFPADTDERIRKVRTEYGTFQYLIFQVHDCYNYGNIRIEGDSSWSVGAGGIAGGVGYGSVVVDVGTDFPPEWRLWGGMVTNSMNFGEIVAPDSAGGIVGSSAEPIKYCGNFGKISAREDTGGIVGYLYLWVDWIQEMPEESLMSECFNVGEVEGDNCAGGIMGDAHSGYFKNCYNTGNVLAVATADEKVILGGIAGGSVSNAIGPKNLYSVGSVDKKGNYCNGILGYFGLISFPYPQNAYFLKENNEYALYEPDKSFFLEEGGVTKEWLMSEEALTALGDAFVADTNHINNGYPVFGWQRAKENEVLVQFRTFGGTQIASRTLFAGDKLVKPADPVKDNGSFLGWYTDAACTNAWNFDTAVTEPMCLYGKWDLPKESGMALVTVDTDGGSYDSVFGYPSQFQIKKGSKLEEIEIPVKLGYRFQGWGVNGSSTKKWDFETDTVTQDTVLKAIWEKQGLLTVRYELCGADNFVDQTYQVDYYLYGGTLIFPTVSRKNHEFGGWFSEKNGKGIQYNENTRVYEDTVLYAYWISVERYTVTFDSRGGTAIEPVEGIVPDTCISLPVPTKENCLFAGWFTEENGEGIRYTSDTPITGNITLYAYWREDLVEKGYRICAIENQTYTGSAVVPKVTVYKDSVLLTEEEDYTVTFANCVEAGKATARVKIKGSGQVFRQYYLIDAKQIEEEDVDITVRNTVLITENKPQVPQVDIVYGGKKLLLKRDYTVTVTEYSKNSGKVKIKGAGNFAGTVEKKFTVVNKKISDTKITPIPKQTYSGKEITPVLEIKAADGSVLTENKDYVCTYYNHIHAGKATVEIQGIGSYAGNKKITFVIEKKQISDEQITVQTDTLTYNGKAQKTSVKVTDNGKELEYQKDYTLQYSNNKNASDKACVTLCGKGDYTGKKKVLFTIEPKDIRTLQAQIQDCVFAQGKEVKGKVTVKDGTKTLSLKKDFTVTYSNNTQIGTAEALLEGTGNYTGTVSLKFRIVEDLVNSTKISKIQPLTYNGEMQKPVLEVTYKGETLEENKDYIVELSEQDSVYAGTAKLTVKGIGKFGGSKTVSYKIEKLSLDAENSDFVLKAAEKQVYTGQAIKPGAELYYKNVRLEEGRDYTLKYKKNVNADEEKKAEIIISGKGNFKGSLHTEFVIEPAKITDVTVNIPDVAYKKGKAAVPKVKVTFGKKILKVNKDYQLLYEPETACKNSTVKIRGIGNFAGLGEATVEVPYHIYEVSIARTSVAKIPNQPLTEDEILEPPLKITYQGEVLKEGADYTLEYENNTKVGTGKVTIKGIGRFGGEKKVSFKIIRKEAAK